MKLRYYLLRRLLALIPTLLGVSLVVFFVARVIPGDPVAVAAGDFATPEMKEAIRQEFGLDKPLVVQYVEYLNRVVRGDLGISLFTRRAVASDLVRVLPATVELTLVSLVISITLGVGGGVAAAVYRDSRIDQIARLLTVSAVSFPRFWLALMLQLLFALLLGLLPVGGRFPAGVQPPPTVTGMYLLDSLLAGDLWRFGIAAQHIVLPAFTLSIGATASILRMTRGGMLEALSRDFVMAARARGFPEEIIILKYALKNALIGTVSVMGSSIVFMLAGAVLVETIFNWPGLGLYIYNASLTLDFVPITGATLVVGLMVALVNLSTDLLYGVLDPRIRYG